MNTFVQGIHRVFIVFIGHFKYVLIKQTEI